MKAKRQQMLLKLIKNQICVTQEDLQNALRKAGFDVTQSTVSRDIKELKLVKGRDKDGNYRYLANEDPTKEHSDTHYSEMFAKSVKSIDYSLNNVVIKCYNGMASSACVAVDAMFGDMMLGSLAGDDTIIMVTRGEKESQQLAKRLENLL
ncbi:MAG: arginine repressor [Acutalibacteraceae bacterium]